MEIKGRIHPVIDAERHPTAFVPAWDRPNPGEIDGAGEARANARLIAAAPEMLALLDRLRRWIVCASITSYDDMAEAVPGFESDISALLAKIDGGV